MISVSSELKGMNTDCLVLSRSGVSDSLQPFGSQPTRLFCPLGFSSRSVGVGCHFLLQGIFPTQGSNSHLLCLLYRRQILYPQSHRESSNQQSLYSSHCEKSQYLKKIPWSSIGRKTQSHTLTEWWSEESRMRGPKRNHKITKAKSHSFGVG